jgi:hypothetical protein
MTLLVSFLDLDRMQETSELLSLVVGVFALVLLALSITAYRKTNLRRLLFVSFAFGLFAVEVSIRQIDFFVFSIGSGTLEVLSTVMDLVILLLFFLALVVSK